MIPGIILCCRRSCSNSCGFPPLRRTSKKLLTEDDRRAIEAELCENLEVGDLIRRTGGFRKLRVALPRGGKSGGARVIYFPDEDCDRIYMILAYGKAPRTRSPGGKRTNSASWQRS